MWNQISKRTLNSCGYDPDREVSVDELVAEFKYNSS